MESDTGQDTENKSINWFSVKKKKKKHDQKTCFVKKKETFEIVLNNTPAFSC